MSDLERLKRLIDITLPLICVCDQNALGYQRAAQLVHDDALEEVLCRYAIQRLEFRQQIVEHVYKPRDLDIEDQSVPPYGELYENWQFLQRDALGDNRILAICQQADFIAITIYDEMLENDDIPKDLLTIIQAQRNGIYRAWEHLSELKKLY